MVGMKYEDGGSDRFIVHLDSSAFYVNYTDIDYYLEDILNGLGWALTQNGGPWIPLVHPTLFNWEV